LALALGMIALAGPALALPTGYTITDLGTLGGDTWAQGLNNLGHVVGHSVAADGQWHPYVWRPGAGMVDIGTAGQNMGAATGINDYGLVCGYAGPSYSSYEAYRWEYGGGTWTGTWLGEIVSGRPYGYARAVNNAGQIVGRDVTGLAGSAFLWEEGTGMVELWGNGGAHDINEGGQVAGVVYGKRDKWSGQWYGCFWDGSSVIRVGEPGHECQFNGLNDLGQCVGWYEPGPWVTDEALLWEDGVFTLLGSLGNSSPIGMDISNSGVVVGYSHSAHAFIWTGETGMLDLDLLLPPDSGWHLTGASAINEAGQIVGNGLHNGVQRGFLLNPISQDPVVPEPTTLALLGLGALGLLRRRR